MWRGATTTVVTQAGSFARRLSSRALRRLGYERVSDPMRMVRDPAISLDIAACEPFTMTTPERMSALSLAVKFVVESNTPGAFVECGVWRGGSSLLMARTLLRLGVSDRELWLYDTFAGMSEPTSIDRKALGGSYADTRSKWEGLQRSGHNEWCYASIDDVRTTLASSNYPETRLHFIEGKVEDTIPEHIPDKIAVLRLDTDFYESTLHELRHLWPRLVPGGVLIVDDYGSWRGSQQAVNEFFKDNPVLLHRIDDSGVTIQKI